MILQGKEPPPEYYTKPDLDIALYYLNEAFIDLSTERHIGQVMGPIPYSKIREYGRDELGLEDEQLYRFIRTVSEIDDKYLSMSRKVDEPLQPTEKKKLKSKVKMRPLAGREKR